MTEFLDFIARNMIGQALLVFAALFPIVNPVGGAPVFLAMTEGLGDAERAQLARRIALNAFLLVLGSIFVGTHVIEFFGLSVPVIQVGGGILVCSVAWDLLRSADAGVPETPLRRPTPAELAARAFYPMTLPLTVGPGSISVAITLGAEVPRGVSAWTIRLIASAAGTMLLALSIYFLFRYAERLTRAIGSAGTQVVLRLSAFILLCIGVEIVWSGVLALIGTVPAFRGP
jgi:multiple antibiotic resistance protein